MSVDWNERGRVQMQDSQIIDDDTGRIHDVREAIAAIPWITAQQYPPPHQYVIFGRCPALAWDVCVFRSKSAPIPLPNRHSFRSKLALVPTQIATPVFG